MAAVPVSVRDGDDQGGRGNRVSVMLVSLATDLDDPRERLEAIKASSERAKRELGWAPRYPTAVSAVQRFREVSPWRLDVWLLLVLWMLSRATRSAAGP